MDLRSIREGQGLTLKDIERKTGLKHSHLSMIETHKASLSDKVAAKLAPVLGIYPGALKEAQTLAAFKHQAEKLQGLDQAALKRAAGKDSKNAAAAVVALTEIIRDETLPVELRQEASKTISKLLDLVDRPAEAQKSRTQGDPDRDLYGRKRPGRKVNRDAVGRAVK